MLLLAALCLFPVFAIGDPVSALIPEEKEEPPYAKWGRLAMKETKEKYPDAAIVDYLHMGRTAENNTVTEQFKLWLRGKEREFGVVVTIRFQANTEEIKEILFEETDR
jgi:hypothetical protein